MDFNPNWPFPQYDEQGKQILPPGWFNKPNKQEKQQELLDEVGEALL